MRAKAAAVLAWVAFASAGEAQPPSAPNQAGPEGPPAVPPGYETAPQTPEVVETDVGRRSEEWREEEAWRDAGHQRHDGFFLRFTAGGGYGRDELRQGGVTTRREGGEVSFALALGGAFTERFVAYTELFLYQVPRSRSESVPDGDALSMSGLGIGVAYYAMPANAYVGGSIAVAGIAIGDGSTVVEQSRPGFGLHLQGGKEWWIASEWALGVALQTFLGWAPAETRDGRHSLLGLGGALTLTYN